MLSVVEVCGPDAMAARLLCGLNRRQVAIASGVSESSVQRLEANLPVHFRTREAVVTKLWELGSRILDHGVIMHIDGRLAPTKKAVGVFHGARLRRTFRNMRLTRERLSVLAKVSVQSIRRLENGTDLNATPTRDFYAVVSVCQLAGMAFGPSRHGGLKGDRLLIDPPEPERRRDRSSYHTKGWRPPGLPRERAEDSGDIGAEKLARARRIRRRKRFDRKPG